MEPEFYTELTGDFKEKYFNLLDKYEAIKSVAEYHYIWHKYYMMHDIIEISPPETIADIGGIVPGSHEHDEINRLFDNDMLDRRLEKLIYEIEQGV